MHNFEIMIIYPHRDFNNESRKTPKMPQHRWEIYCSSINEISKITSIIKSGGNLNHAVQMLFPRGLP